MSPIIILVMVFVVADPFDNIFYDSDLKKQDFFGAYPDFQTTEDYLASYESQKYNGYIFGNSRSTAFLPSELEARIGEGSNFFKFGSPGESILNVEHKVQMIDCYDQKIDHVVFLIDDEMIKNFNNEFYDPIGPEYLHHPSTSNLTYPGYYYKHFMTFLNEFYFVRYLDYRITGEFKPYMEGYFVPDEAKEKFMDGEYELEGYEFPERENPGGKTEHFLNDVQKERLQNIQSVFVENETDYTIIIPPLYDQEYMNDSTLNEIKLIFGEANVHDFSGINEITSSSSNYYEESHFRVNAANWVLDQIFGLPSE